MLQFVSVRKSLLSRTLDNLYIPFVDFYKVTDKTLQISILVEHFFLFTSL